MQTHTVFTAHNGHTADPHSLITAHNGHTADPHDIYSTQRTWCRLETYVKTQNEHSAQTHTVRTKHSVDNVLPDTVSVYNTTMGIVQTHHVSITQAEHTLCLGVDEITVGYVGQGRYKDHGNRLERGYGSSIPVTYKTCWSQHDTLCVQDVYTHSAEAVVPYAEPAVNCSWQAGLTQSQGRRPPLHTQTMQIL